MTKRTMMSEASDRSIRVSDLIEIMKRLENLLESPGYKNPSLVDSIRNMRRILHPYRDLPQQDFMVLLRDSLRAYRAQRNGTDPGRRRSIDSVNLTLDDLRTLLAGDVLRKEQLLDIADRRFGIPRGTCRRMRKDQIRDLIEGAMKNIETHEVIRSKASE